MIKFKNMTKRFETKIVFDHFNVEVDKGEMIAVVAPSGSGKSTLLNIIGLIDAIDGGEYHFEQQVNVKPNSSLAQKIIREKISYLFQNFALIEEDTVQENLLLALKYAHHRHTEKINMIKAALQ
ncbi:ATP-binding cassette domain-containing protein, partial [Lactobacillus sp. XV13L]|nr:ATP-binding cassette domain-containing protein [Lactobacillus sp. XV13L]